MRIPHIAKASTLGIALFLGAGVERSLAVPSPIVLTIDDSNPSAVIITASGFPATANNSGKPVSSGVDLLGFFTANQSLLFGQSLAGSNLAGGNSGVSYNNVKGDNFSTAGGDALDLRLFVDGSSPNAGNPQTFTTLQPAFTGTWVLDLAGLGVSGSALPAVGTTGDILSGFSGDQGAIIGKWEIQTVPEPSLGSLFLLGSGIAFLARRIRCGQ